ncbi:hypothetical protein L1887_27756 [Cichorium endivia]|nr:hypothetical protein L1887_27756 [Cichorium endivia]
METGLLTKESDVYSFGVVLFEVLCGRLCINDNNGIHQSLTSLVRRYYPKNKINDLIFGNIKDGMNPKSLETFITIAYQCLKRDSEERPLMSDVVSTLEKALEYQSGISSTMVTTETGSKNTLPEAGQSSSAASSIIPSHPAGVANTDLFEMYFKRADLDKDGIVSGAEALPFFQATGLPKSILSEIWNYIDEDRNGYLHRRQFNNFLKLVTVAQSKRELTPDIVKAALYGPASSKIPAPQINLVTLPTPQQNLNVGQRSLQEILTSYFKKPIVSREQEIKIRSQAGIKRPTFDANQKPNGNCED